MKSGDWSGAATDGVFCRYLGGCRSSDGVTVGFRVSAYV